MTSKTYVGQFSKESRTPNRVIGLSFQIYVIYFCLECFNTLEMSMKEAAYWQRFALAFMRRLCKTNTASRVLLPRRKPYCSSPRRPWVSVISDMILVILMVTRRRMLEGMVMGRKLDGSRESPPCSDCE